MFEDSIFEKKMSEKTGGGILKIFRIKALFVSFIHKLHSAGKRVFV